MHQRRSFSSLIVNSTSSLTAAVARPTLAASRPHLLNSVRFWLDRFGRWQFLAKLATNLAKPKGVRVLLRRDVPSLLASTPATKIPGCGTGSAAAKQFLGWGARSIFDLRQIDAAELRKRLGEQLGAKVSSPSWVYPHAQRTEVSLCPKPCNVSVALTSVALVEGLSISAYPILFACVFT